MSVIHSEGHTNFKRLAEARRRRDALLDVPLDDEAAESPIEDIASSIADEPPPLLTFHPVRRVLPNDLPELSTWLLPRLETIWPANSSAVWSSKLRAFMMSNDAMFVRTENAVALAVAARGDMDGRLVIREKFVLCRDRQHRLPDNKLHPWEAEMVALYRHIRDWARSKDAVRLYVLECADIFYTTFDKYLGWNLTKRNECYFRLAK